MTDAPVVLALTGLRKEFGQTVAVAELSLEVRRGELVCLLGPSGCGKTTTLQMVAGFVEPSAGHIAIAGAEVTRLPPHRRDTGMVFQSYALFPHLTVAANIEFGLRNIGMAREARRARVAEMLRLVELAELGRRLPRQLSGGQQQRVALARALALKPAVLLLDEPFSNLDAQLRVRMRAEMRALIAASDTTTLFVTHDQEEALAMVDRIVVMNRGRVEQVGSPGAIYETPRSRFVAQFMGRCNLLAATVREMSGDRLVAATEGGLVLHAKAEAPVPAPGSRIALALRPEHLGLWAPGAAAENRIAGRIRAVSYLGATTELTVAAAGETLLVEAHAAPRGAFAVGDALSLAVAPERVRALSEDDRD